MLTVMMPVKRAQETHAKIIQCAQDMGALLLEMKHEEGWRALGFATWMDYLDSFEESRATLYRLMDRTRAQQESATVFQVSAGLEPQPITGAAIFAEMDTSTAALEPNTTGFTPQNTEPNSLEISKSVSQNEKYPLKNQHLENTSSPPPENPKRKAAEDYLEKVLGKEVGKSLRNGVLNLADSEVIYWGAMSDEEIREIAPLVIEKRWLPRKAFAFVRQQIDENTRISSLQLLSVKKPCCVTIAGFETITCNRREHAEAIVKFKRAIGADL